MKKNLIRWLLPVVVLLNACKKDDATPAGPVTGPAKGVYVLSEGNFGQNNTKLSFRSVATGLTTGDFFLQQNPALTGGLGDSGNDFIIYGGKMYIIMNGSNNIQVLNASTAVLIDSIALPGGPRFALGTRGKVYVSAYDGKVRVIDTTSLSIMNTINVGTNPEGIATFGNYLYVANSGGFNAFPAPPDSTVSVIDLNTNTEIKKITACVNPQKIEINAAGTAYVSSFGNFSSIPPAVAVINCATNERTAVLNSDYAYDHIRIFNDIAYFYNNYGGASVKLYNTITNTLVRDNFITDGTVIQTSYGVNIDEENGDVYITDAKNFSTAGSVTCFDKNGVKKFSFPVSPGVSPNKVLFVR